MTNQRPKGPRAPDWLLALGCSVLIAAEILNKGELQRIQSGVSYYFDSPWVPQIHTLALVINGAVFVNAVLWFLTPFKRACQRTMVGLALFGIALAWFEIVYALQLQSEAVYVLNQLPFRPVNNLGVIGAQVFVSYLVLKAPSGRLEGWRSWVVKIALAAAFWPFQFIVWQMLVPR